MATVQDMNMPHIIGLMGAKQSGKDSFAQFLVEDHGFARVAFADPMKEILMALDPFIPEPGLRLSVIVKRMGWDFAKERYPEVRKLLQRLGTEAGRDILGKNIWINTAADQIARNVRNGVPVVITDVRFENEYREVKEWGGLIVRIERPGLVQVDNHASEQEWRSIVPDHVVVNNGTLENLRTAAAFLLGATEGS